MERRWRPLLARVTGAIATLVTLAGVAAILVALLTPPGLHFPFPIALLCDLGTAAIIAIAVAKPATSAIRVIGIGPIAAVGRGSYSLYLWHWPVIVLMRWTVGLDDMPRRLIAVAASFALGFACYRLIEQPTQRWPWLRAGHPGQQIRRQILLLATGLVVSEGLLRAKDSISLSRTADVGIWYGGKGDLHVGPPPSRPVIYARSEVEGGRLSVWSPARPIATRGFVIGDSHSLPYYPALRRLAEDRGIAIRAYFIPDCSFLPLSKPMRELAICHLAFYRHALREVAASGRKGDVLFLPNLRLPRYVDQWGPVHSWSMTDAGAPERRARATAEALALLRPVAARGVTILFESPTPVFRLVPFRCADWFNRGNPVCAAGFTVQRSEMDALRSAPLEQMRTIAHQLPGVRIWNAFDLLCPGDPCSAVRGDRPLFMDGDHLSGFSVSLICPSLKDAILAASASPNGSPPPRRPAP